MFDWSRDYFHRDRWYGHNDWQAVVAFVRALMHDSEVPWCHPFARRLILEQHTPMTQTLLQHLGQLRDERGIEIIAARLSQPLTAQQVSFATPWCKGGEPFEWVCLEALAPIGGPGVAEIFERYLGDPAKAHLHPRIAELSFAERPQRTAAPLPADFPEILKDVHSINDLVRPEDPADNAKADCDDGKEDSRHESDYVKRRRRQIREQRRRADEIISLWRKLPFPGKIETLSGDGSTRTFKLRNRITGHIRNLADPFSDFGIFASDPKVEYPLGLRRWAGSHTFLHFHHPDGSYWDREYTIDVDANTITTHFRELIPLEQVTVNADGQSVTVARTPIATAIETRGNVWSGRCNSSVRGVWDNPEKTGRNYYARRANVLTPYKKLCYIAPLHEPLIDVFGLWLVDESDNPQRFFASDGECNDIKGVIEELLIPLHEPKVLALTAEPYRPAGAEDRFGRRLPRKLWPELTRVPPASRLDPFLGVKFIPHRCGAAGWETGLNNGYNGFLDLNSDGMIDQRDRDILARHAGEVWRYNMMQWNYFGANWLGAGYGSRSRNFDHDPPLYVISYDYGAGYDAPTGRINLAYPAPPGARMYVEYACDVPAAPGRDNIRVYVHDPLEPAIPLRPYHTARDGVIATLPPR